MCKLFCGIFNLITNISTFFSHIVNAVIRYYLFTVFFFSGLTKINSWETTLALFDDEYKVTWLPLLPSVIEQYDLHMPVMSSTTAAYIATGAELGLSALLFAGLGARVPALLLFIFNYAALCSYDFLWTPEGMAGMQDHLIWGSLLGYSLFYGHGKLSLDQFLKFRWNCYKY